jgi:hypothetical protein
VLFDQRKIRLVEVGVYGHLSNGLWSSTSPSGSQWLRSREH